MDALEAAVRDVEARLGEALAPLQAALDRLGVRHAVARVIVAEIGFDLSRQRPGTSPGLASARA